jgi:P27 family predicted phage terminase small subunit
MTREELDEALRRNREELDARREYNNSYSFEDAPMRTPTRMVEKSFETPAPPERAYHASSWSDWQDWGTAVAERVVERAVTAERELLIESVSDALAEIEKGLRAEIAALNEVLDELGSLPPHRLHLLRLACEAYDRCQSARERLAAEGLTFQDKNGDPRAHPAVAIERDSRVGFARLLRELGLDAPIPQATNTIGYTPSPVRPWGR